MQGFTEEFGASLQTSHEIISYITVISPTQEESNLLAISGDIQVDGTAEVRRRLNATCVDPQRVFLPTADGSGTALTPFGTELRPYRGIVYADGTTEVLPLGVFRLSKVTVSEDNGGLSIGLEAYDLSRTVSRDKFTSPYPVNVGVNVITTIQDILARTFPDLDYDAISSSLTVASTLLFDVGDDPWKAVTTLAISVGCEIFFDVSGRVVIRPPTDISDIPRADWSYVEDEKCTLLSLQRTFNDEGGFNGVVVTAESHGDALPAIRSVIWDEEPTSLTYHLGAYGEVPLFYTDQIIKTQQDADNAANSLLAKQLGFLSQLSITVTVNPAFEPGDVVGVTRLSTNLDDNFILDSFNVPLGASETQTLTLRQKRFI